jgi:hypothetical protein
MPTYKDLGFSSFLSKEIPSTGQTSLDWKKNIKPGSISFNKVSMINPLTLSSFTVANLPKPIIVAGPAVGTSFSY